MTQTSILALNCLIKAANNQQLILKSEESIALQAFPDQAIAPDFLFSVSRAFDLPTRSGTGSEEFAIA
jgi:hypothetical protein